jgi:hypothetical protein
VLKSHKVFSVGSVRRDLGSEEVLVVRAPGRVSEGPSLVANTFLVDLEPVAVASVALDVVPWSTGHVDKTGT